MRFLIQILDKADIARKGDWTVGNCVLAVCYSILLHHNSSSTITGNYFCKCYLVIGLDGPVAVFYYLICSLINFVIIKSDTVSYFKLNYTPILIGYYLQSTGNRHIIDVIIDHILFFCSPSLLCSDHILNRRMVM